MQNWESPPPDVVFTQEFCRHNIFKNVRYKVLYISKLFRFELSHANKTTKETNKQKSTQQQNYKQTTSTHIFPFFHSQILPIIFALLPFPLLSKLRHCSQIDPNADHPMWPVNKFLQ